MVFERGAWLLYVISSALGAAPFTVLIAASTMGRVLAGMFLRWSASGICLALISSSFPIRLPSWPKLTAATLPEARGCPETPGPCCSVVALISKWNRGRWASYSPAGERSIHACRTAGQHGCHESHDGEHPDRRSVYERGLVETDLGDAVTGGDCRHRESEVGNDENRGDQRAARSRRCKPDQAPER